MSAFLLITASAQVLLALVQCSLYNNQEHYVLQCNCGFQDHNREIAVFATNFPFLASLPLFNLVHCT